MTIDEAIKHAREVAERKKKAFQNCEDDCRFCLASKPCNESAEEHEQLAEWLEELQNLKAENTYLHDEMQAIGATIDMFEEEIRNKAIDDVFQWLCNSKYAAWEIDVDREGLYFDNEFVSFDEIAQQLKDGGTDG